MTPAHTVYLCRDETYDLGRWLEFRLEPTGDISLTISDPNHPAGVRFTCAIRELQVVAEGLESHLSERGNFCAFRAKDGYVEIEYAAGTDEHPRRCSIKLDDFRQALGNIYPGVSFPLMPSVF